MNSYRSPQQGGIGHGGGLCPVCSAQIRPGASFCDVCQVQVRVDGARLLPVHPEIRRGEVLLGLDFSKDPLPGTNARAWKGESNGGTGAPIANGIQLTFPKPFSYSLLEPGLRVRDACVRAAFTALEPDMHFGVVARAESLGTSRTQYQLEIFAEQRAVRLCKFFRTDKVSGLSALIPWTQNPAVAPVGYPNEIELRLQGATLQGWINNVNVLSAHDLSWGIGQPAIRFGRQSANQAGPARVIAHMFEVRGVAA